MLRTVEAFCCSRRLRSKIVEEIHAVVIVVEDIILPTATVFPSFAIRMSRMCSGRMIIYEISKLPIQQKFFGTHNYAF